MFYYFLSGTFSLGREEAETIEALERMICNAVVKFEGNVWAQVPDNAKDLISKMLVADPKVRLTAQQCIEHPFFRSSDDDDASSGAQSKIVTFEADVFKNLLNFKGVSKLKKAALNLFVR